MIDKDLRIINMDDVEATDVKWLWYPYIPYGKITIIQGDPGEGKTTLVLNLAALLTRGEKLPESEITAEPINVLYQSAESELNKLTGQLSEHLSDEFKKQFHRFEGAANQSELQIAEHTTKCITELSELTAKLKAKQQRSFTRKSVMFWINIAAIISLVLLEVLRILGII